MRYVNIPFTLHERWYCNNCMEDVRHEFSQLNISTSAVTQFIRKTAQFKCREIASAEGINEENYSIHFLRRIVAMKGSLFTISIDMLGR